MQHQGPRTGIQPFHYHTPRVPQPQQLQQLMLTSKTLSRLHKTPKTPSTAHHSPTHQSSFQNQKADLLALGEWLRWAAVTLGVGKHVFDNAVGLLREGSQKLDCTYALAAASLAIATKLQHGHLISRHSQLPVKPAPNLPKVSLKEAIKVQGLLLNTLEFQIPVCDRKLFLLTSLTERWNRYLKRNSRHLNIPIHLVQAGLGGRWQKRNLTCAGYLLDLLSLGAAEYQACDQILLAASLATVGAVNCCQPEQLNTPTFILVKFAKCFLKRCYQLQQSSLQDLTYIFDGIYRNKLWHKLALVPSDKQNKKMNFQSQDEKLQWLNQLEFIPFIETKVSQN